ncbi:unnamed protein product [Symbiodinium necroappetens]|uniref:Uncharacterized protein n=1 Tax=Symbiodinium necroappetens TaxID=1628268 RepID=A0A812VN93_9DINO|nr:unnamed protein product [Symbiodinium necroappetens]
MEGDASGKIVAFTRQDNVAYITRFVMMDCFSPDKNFAFMTVLCCISMWGGNFGEDVHLQILKHLWPKGWRLTSSIVYQPVRPCLSVKRYRRGWSPHYQKTRLP